MSKRLKCLAPVVDARTKVLILGSFPGPESLARQEYYAHKTNRFWPICAAGALSYAAKKRALKKKRLGLWDVIGSCRRSGSSDNNIKNPYFNDILTLLKAHPNIKTVCFNGKKAEGMFHKAFRKLPAGIKFKSLPSTSSANAQLSPKEKKKIWGRAFRAALCRFIMLSCCSALLAGCASLPVKSTPSYSLDDIYKRLSYKTDGGYRVVNIFYATSRLGDKPKLADKVRYGTLDVRIDPRVRIGLMLPDKLSKKGILQIQDTRELEPDVFTDQLSAAVNASPHKSLLVLVFGFKDGFEATALKAAYFAYLLDVNTPVLLFDWPGDQSVSFGGYMKAQSLASASGPYMAEVLAKVVREVKPEKVWIEASSLGCQVVCDAFEELYKQPDFSDEKTEFDHIILAAPDVGKDEFKGRFKDGMIALVDKMTVYVASDDDALLMSGFISGEQKLGRAKLRMKDPEQLEEARDLLYTKSLAPERLMVIDVTPINHASFKHGYYLECQEYYDDFYMRIFDTEPRLNRRLYLLKTVEGVDYWVMQDSKE